MNNILVSICCITYNHERYIADAIESFLMQKTKFNFEIIIHDDASTDGTKSIIEDYSKRYPEIISPIYQTTNQLSQGRKIFPTLFEKAKGKYIALCEGDDYWTDDLKLQIQADFLLNNPNYCLCVHSTNRMNYINKSVSIIGSFSKSKPFGMSELLYNTDTIFHTSSMIFKSEFVKILPQYYYTAPVGDFPIKVHLLSLGEAYYINKTMSTHRYKVPESWSESQTNYSNYFQKINNTITMLNEINSHTGYKYNDALRYRIMHNEVIYIAKSRKYKYLFNKKYSTYLKSLSFITTIKLYIKIFFTKLYFTYIKSN